MSSWVDASSLFRAVDEARLEKLERARKARLEAIRAGARPARPARPAPRQAPLLQVVRSPGEIAAAVLAAHELSVRTRVSRSGSYQPIGYCSCGRELGPKRTDEGVRRAWRAHVAAIGERVGG